MTIWAYVVRRVALALDREEGRALHDGRQLALEHAVAGGECHGEPEDERIGGRGLVRDTQPA